MTEGKMANRASKSGPTRWSRRVDVSFTRAPFVALKSRKNAGKFEL